jgi:hypothetical protein
MLPAMKAGFVCEQTFSAGSIVRDALMGFAPRECPGAVSLRARLRMRPVFMLLLQAVYLITMKVMKAVETDFMPAWFFLCLEGFAGRHGKRRILKRIRRIQGYGYYFYYYRSYYEKVW